MNRLIRLVASYYRWLRFRGQPGCTPKVHAPLKPARLGLFQSIFFCHSHHILFAFLSSMSFSAPAEQLPSSRLVNINDDFLMRSKSLPASGQGNGLGMKTTCCLASIAYWWLCLYSIIWHGLLFTWCDTFSIEVGWLNRSAMPEAYTTPTVVLADIYD